MYGRMPEINGEIHTIRLLLVILVIALMAGLVLFLAVTENTQPERAATAGSGPAHLAVPLPPDGANVNMEQVCEAAKTARRDVDIRLTVSASQEEIARLAEVLPDLMKSAGSREVSFRMDTRRRCPGCALTSQVHVEAAGICEMID